MLSEEQVQQFHRDGFLAGGPCLTGAEVDELRSEIERVIADQERPGAPQPALIRDTMTLGREDQPPAEAASAQQLWQIVNIWMASEPFRRLLEHPKITTEIAQLTGAEELRVWHDQIQYKPAEIGGVNMWHQDAPAWPVITPMTEVSAWVALDDVDESNGCMSMVPGSHTWGDHSAFLNQLESYDAMPSVFKEHEVRVVRRPVGKGEVHYHHALTWHGSHENTSGRRRRAVAIHYMLKGTRFVASGEHAIKHLIEVPDGQPIEGAYFPLCYAAPALAG